MISVPVVGEGGIHGYVMAQFIFTVDCKAMNRTVGEARRVPAR